MYWNHSRDRSLRLCGRGKHVMYMVYNNMRQILRCSFNPFPLLSKLPVNCPAALNCTYHQFNYQKHNRNYNESVLKPIIRLFQTSVHCENAVTTDCKWEKTREENFASNGNVFAPEHNYAAQKRACCYCIADSL